MPNSDNMKKKPHTDPLSIDTSDIYLDMLAAAMLLTRVPIDWPDGKKPAKGRIYWAFGLVGIGIAAVPVMAATILLTIGAPALAVIALMLAGMALLSGGMHQDGLADVADSLGGPDKQSRLAIMHDSRLGSFGILGLICVSLVTIACLAALADISPGLMAGGAFAVAALSRSMMAVQRYLHEPPSTTGIASTTGKPEAMIAIISVMLSLLLAMVFINIGAALAMLIIGLIVTFALGWFVKLWIGGVNGDGLGATQQLSEAMMLLALVIAIG